MAGSASKSQWLVMLVFTLSSAINYLDRLLLSSLQPALEAEFHLSSKDFGFLHSAFYMVYTVSSPLAGMIIDRVGLTLGITSAVGLWSLAGVATGFTSGLTGLVACRMWLGAAEGAVIPGSGKATGLYIEPSQRALGAAIGQVGLTLGMIAAPLLASFISPRYGWRVAFVIAGLLGFVWIPLWIWFSRRNPPSQVLSSSAPAGSTIWRDRRVFGLVAANMLGMAVYSLWTGWTTKFLVHTYAMKQDDANLRLAWIPPIFQLLGGLAGGAISYRMARQGASLPDARVRAAMIGAVALLSTAAAPHLGSAALATAAIGFSAFWSLVFSVNVYSLPVDLFGPERAASGVAALTGAYGLMSVFISPMIGASVDRYGFAPACAIIAVLPLLACFILRWTIRQA
ncbi:MAG: MFS transporter [Acidobacteria bacterium]|nr:MFS transporter [Acidobacteriota bacterium]